MAISYDDIPASVYDDSIREQFSEYHLDDTHTGYYNFVCPNPECGNVNMPNKKKAYIYTDTWQYVCWKCTPMMPYAKWLRQHDEDAYQRLLFSAFGARRGHRDPGDSIIRKRTVTPVDVSLPFKEGELIPITDSHPLAVAALNLCKQRRIREEVYSEWFVCLQGDQFLDRDKDGNYVLDENGRPTGNKYRNRIIIPYYHFGGKWFQFDARAIFKENPLRYLNFAGVKRGAYNIDFINYDEYIYILEGSIDSTFVHNAIAIGGISHFDTVFEENPGLKEHKDRVVVIWDNDEKAREARSKTCDMGLKWFNWEGIRSKDVNAAVISGEFPVDEEGFVRRDVIEARIRDPEGANILFTLKYGNMQKEAEKKRFEGIRSFKEKRNTRKAEVYF